MSIAEIEEATNRHDIERVRELLSKTDNMETNLSVAVSMKIPKTIDLLLKCGDDLNYLDEDGYTPLGLACMRGYTSIVSLLLTYGADPNIGDEVSRKPLRSAVRNGDYHMVSLLSRHTDINEVDYRGYTVLHEVAYMRDPDMVCLLLKCGASVSILDEQGRTPLFNCTDARTTTILLDAGSDPNIRDIEGSTVLHHFVMARDIDNISLLLSKGGDLDITDKHGRTPLMFAVWKNRADVVSLLLSKSANVNIKDDNGDSAWDYSIDEKISSMLKENM